MVSHGKNIGKQRLGDVEYHKWRAIYDADMTMNDRRPEGDVS
jgi:hypothetical protein